MYIHLYFHTDIYTCRCGEGSNPRQQSSIYAIRTYVSTINKIRRMTIYIYERTGVSTIVGTLAHCPPPLNLHIDEPKPHLYG
jgi:hypothetical protein